MAKSTNLIHGSTLTRSELEPLLPMDVPIPFVYVYACAVQLKHGLDGLEVKLNSLKKDIPDFKGIVKYGEGKDLNIIIEFIKKQWGIQFSQQENEVTVQMTFREQGKDWGSNYALWLRHRQWIFDKLGAKLVKELMDHVDPSKMRLPKN